MGVVFEQNFEDEAIDETPNTWVDPWTYTVDDPSIVKVVASPVHAGNRAALIYSGNTSTATYASIQKNALTVDDAQIDYYVRATQINKTLSALYTMHSHSPTTGEAGICVVFWNDAKIKYNDGGSWEDSGITYNATTWYHIRYVIHNTARTYDLYIDNMVTPIATGIDYRNDLSCDYLNLMSGTNFIGSIYVDDITITTAGEVKELAGTIAAQSALTANIKSTEALAGLVECQSAIEGYIEVIEELSGLIAAQAALIGNLQEVKELAGLVAAQSSLTGNIVPFITVYDLSGLINAQSGLTGSLLQRFIDIPPFMEKDLIDPFASGAWLWLVQIAVPGQSTVRIARNTEDVHYDTNDFDKFNLQIGEQIFSGDGSIPRVTLQICQDVNRTIEDLVNETEGALGASVKLIRVNEKFLTSPVDALEADYDNLASQSDTEWVTFTLGIPNPLTQRFPLWLFSSSMCPWCHPDLFKGPECQLPLLHGDTTCTGIYEDCYTKDNAEHWGGELGLDPSVVRGNK